MEWCEEGAGVGGGSRARDPTQIKSPKTRHLLISFGFYGSLWRLLLRLFMAHVLGSLWLLLLGLYGSCPWVSIAPCLGSLWLLFKRLHGS